MTGVLQDYLTRFASTARAAGVPGRRIGEAVAEIESHVASSAESPQDVFGDPVQYARQLSREQTESPPRRPYWQALAEFYSFCIGGLAIAAGVYQLADRPGPRLGATVAAAVAVSLAAALTWAPAYRRDPHRIGALWGLPALLGAAVGVLAAWSWRDTGLQLPPAALLTGGAVLLTAGITSMIRAVPRGEPIIDPHGRDRSDLARRAINGRFLFAGTAILVLALFAISLWTDLY